MKKISLYIATILLSSSMLTGKNAPYEPGALQSLEPWMLKELQKGKYDFSSKKIVIESATTATTLGPDVWFTTSDDETVSAHIRFYGTRDRIYALKSILYNNRKIADALGIILENLKDEPAMKINDCLQCQQRQGWISVNKVECKLIITDEVLKQTVLNIEKEQQEIIAKTPVCYCCLSKMRFAKAKHHRTQECSVCRKARKADN